MRGQYHQTMAQWLFLLLTIIGVCHSFVMIDNNSHRLLLASSVTTSRARIKPLNVHNDEENAIRLENNKFQSDDDRFLLKNASKNNMNRRNVIRSTLVASMGVLPFVTNSNAYADDDVSSSSVETFESIAARAGRISREVEATNPTSAQFGTKTDKTVYDFTLPIKGVPVSFSDMIRQEYTTETLSNGQTIQIPKVKVIIVVNIKQDDPVARKTIPELISLAAKYGRGDSSQIAIIASPTDQGYFEPDTSQLIRLKLESEYGYGINPSTILTDKVNLLGTGAVPFWRWIQSTCRTPAGLGRIEGNFEKFLIDGRTGLPVRRYPRKYKPLNMVDDIEALIAGRPIPPARANWLEEWRTSAAEADRDTYRFEKGLNVFDQ